MTKTDRFWGRWRHKNESVTGPCHASTVFCLVCRCLGPDICERCRSRLEPAPDRLLPDGLVVKAAFRHQGPARDLVHHFKYRGSDRAGWILARAVAPLLARGITIVPIPRPRWRYLRYGIDPAPDLARRLQALTGCHLSLALVPPAISPRQAGRRLSDRQVPALAVSSRPRLDSILLVDDVCTTGRTLSAAAATLRAAGIGVDSAITATSSGD